MDSYPNLSSPSVILHIGANKTASTTFQKNCFIKLSDLVYRGEEDPLYSEYGGILKSIIDDDPLFYDEAKSREFIASFLKEGPGLMHLFSSEDISRSRVPTLCSRRFADLMPQACVLLVLRNQKDAVQSWYFNHGAFLRDAPKPYWRRYVNFNNWLNYQLMTLHYSHLAVFDYKNIILPYEQAFGRDRIHILLYEEFLSDAPAFCAKLGSLLGVEAQRILEMVRGKWDRKRLTQAQFLYQKTLGSFWPIKWDNMNSAGSWIEKALNALLGHGKACRLRMSEKDSRTVEDLYKEGNEYMRLTYRLPLETYGYPLP